LLLDTHVLLWFAAGDDRLGRRGVDAILDPANTILVSLVSLWEAAIKMRAGKLSADMTALIDGIAQQGFELLHLRAAHIERLLLLPVAERHRDPFDHLLLAQAATESATFLTDDGNAGQYGIPVLRSR
jgi:PIN domain nuclease of toxin-antitoxin system